MTQSSFKVGDVVRIREGAYTVGYPVGTVGVVVGLEPPGGAGSGEARVTVSFFSAPSDDADDPSWAEIYRCHELETVAPLT